MKQQYFYRPLGGEVHPGETAKEALIREIHEELNQEISDLRLLGVLENLFVLEGVTGHEIVFVYDAKFIDDSIYEQACLSGREDNGEVFEATWRSLNSFDSHHRLVPESLSSLL